MTILYTEGKIKPAIQNGKVADFVDIDGLVGINQVVAALRDGSIILPDETTGNLPDPSMNQGRFALTDSGVALSRNHSVDAVVTFKLFGPDRVVAAGEAAISSKEMLYRGVVLNTVNPPPVADADVGAYYWSISGQVWLHKSSSIQTAWQESNHPGAPLVFNSFIYGTEAEAANHVHGVGNWQPNGRSVAIIGHGNGQLAYVLTAYTAPITDNWQWDPLGITQADIQAHIAQHNTATDAHDDIRTEIDTDISTHNTATNAHNDIRSSLSTAEDRLDALNAVEIEPYDLTATYSRGSANSIVTHSGGLYIYISATERSSNHDPDTQPGYWLELSEGVTYTVLDNNSYRFSARTLVIFDDTDETYLCTTTQTTPRNKAYIRTEAASIGGAFIHLNGTGSAGTTVAANPSGTDGDTLTRITIDGTNYNLPAPMGGGLSSVTSDATLAGSGTSGSPLGVADDGISTAKIADDAVTGDKIADNTIHGGALIDGTIPTGKIGDDQVTGDKLSDNAVSTGKVANDAITQDKIADDAVGADQLDDGSVTTAKIADDAVTQTKLAEFSVVTEKIANLQVTSGKLAANAAGEGKVPIDNTLQFDGSGNLGVEISTVIDLLDEDIRYYSTDTTREDARQASKGVVFLDTSRYAKRIHSVEWDFEGDGVGHNYTTFFVGIDNNDDISFIYGESETLFNVGTSGTRRFNFDSSGLRIPGNVERLGLFITRTGSDATWETKVYRGQPASDSPRESYPDASVDFPFWRSARFASGRPEIGEHIDNYITNGEIYGYPKIRYTLELEHASLVGDGNITPAHIDSGSSADGTVLTADGSGGSAFESLPDLADDAVTTSKIADSAVTNAKIADVAASKVTGTLAASAIPGSLTHRQAQAVTVNGNVLDIPTETAVQGGDTVLFVVPTPWTATGNLTVRVTQGGVVQANTTLALNDRVGTRLTGSDIVAEEEMEIILATDWRSLVHPIGSGTGTTVTANPSGTDGDDLTRLSISGTNYNIAGQISWGFVIDTLIVPELNQDAITAARIVLEDSALTHYLAFLDWTQANLDMISHLPVGAHIGLRQDTTIRILRVEAEWDSTNNRYQVININAGGLLEQASGTATELLLTAGVLGGGDTVLDRPKQVVSIPSAFDEALLYLTHDELASGGAAAHETITIGEDSGAFGYSDGTALPVTLGSTTGSSPVAFITGDGAETSGTITSFTPNEVGSHHRDFMDTYTTIVIDGTDYVLGDVVFRFGAYRRSINSPPTITDGNFTYNFKNASDNLYFTDAVTTNEAGLWQWEEDASPAAYERVGSGGDGSGSGDLKGQRIASITFGSVPTSGSSLETSASGSGTRLDSGDIGGTGSDVGWVRDTGAPTAFTVERIGASSDEPIINIPQTRPAADSFGYLVELEILPHLGTLSNAIAVGATSIIFALEPTEDIAIGDDLRIESEVVTVDAVPAEGATGVAALTYGIVRGQEGTDAAAHTNTRMIQKNSYELESDGIILQGGPSPQQGGSSSRSTISLGTGGLVDATGIRELGVRMSSTRSTVGLSGLEQVRLIDLISQGDNAVLLPSTRITVYLAIIAAASTDDSDTEDPLLRQVASSEVTTDGTTNWLWADTGIPKAGDSGWDQAASVFQIELEQHGVVNEPGRALVTSGLIRKSEFNTLSSPDENNGVLPANANSDDDAERYNVHMRETQSGGGLDMVIGRRANGNIIIAGESGGHTYTVRVLSLEGGGAQAEEEGQQSPEGVSSLTTGYVHTLFYKYAISEPAVHAANWRFDDEWSNTDGPPSDGWYDTAAEALTTAALNPNFVEADNTLWECRGRFRRRLNNDGDAYIYSDSKEVFAVFGEQFSEDGESWHGTQADADIWQRIRTDLGDWGTPTYIGIPGEDVWEILRTFINAYRTGDEHSVANVSMPVDLTEYSELRFRMYGLSSGVTSRAPIIENVIQRPESGWPVDNDDASTFNNHGAFQWRYGAVANIFNIGLMGTMQPALTSHVTQEVVDPSDINNVWTVTIQAGGRFKFYSSSNSESDVDSLVIFDQPGSYQRVRIEVSGR